MKRLLIAALLAFAAVGANAKETFFGGLPAQPAPHPSLYSFADVYRLTVGGQIAPVQFPVAAEAPVRVAVTQPAAASEAQFSFSVVREPQRWALLAAGLLLAAWVARRRIDAVL